MVKLYIADCDCLTDDKLFEKYYALADGSRKNKVDALTGEARRASLGAYALLGIALSKDGLSMGEWTFSEGGKPHFKDERLPSFSLSHSLRYALCALSDCKVGCDIQFMRPFDERILKRVLCPSELAAFRLISGEEAREYFYRAWTVKESYVKFTGEGLSRRFCDLEYRQGENGEIWLCGQRQNVSVSCLSFGQYKIACTFSGNPPYGLEQIIL